MYNIYRKSLFPRRLSLPLPISWRIRKFSGTANASALVSFTVSLLSQPKKNQRYIVFPFRISKCCTKHTETHSIRCFFFRTNLTIIQVKAACDGDNMRIVGELNTNQHSCTALLTQHTRFTCIHAGTRYRAHDSPSLVFR